MADYLPKFHPGQPFTTTAAADVTGQRLVSVAGSKTVGPSPADSPSVVGVAGTDVLSGEKVLVYPRTGGVQRLVANGAIAAGAKVISATGGKVATIGAGTNSIGIALQSAAADNDVLDVLFL